MPAEDVWLLDAHPPPPIRARRRGRRSCRGGCGRRGPWGGRQRRDDGGVVGAGARHTGGLTVLARAGHGRYALHTAHGAVTFLAGVNLGATTPGHQPGELAITAADYRRWFAEMGRLGIRAVRIYTIHPPAFYTELRAYDRSHPDAPLYLVQGVYLPDESYPARPCGLYDPAVESAFRKELGDAVGAVRGDLERAPARGRADGR